MRRALALAALAVLVTAGAVALWPSRPNQITKENRDRIKEGMSRAEVEAILGPPGDYRTGLGERESIGNPFWDPDLTDYEPVMATWRPVRGSQGPSLTAGTWKCDSIEILVMTDDESGRVVYADAFARRSAGSPLQNVLWRAKRQWHRWFPE